MSFRSARARESAERISERARVGSGVVPEGGRFAAAPDHDGLLADVVRLPATEAAPALLGWTLLVDGVGGVIVETEAYTEDDPASHTYRGRTPRNAVMFASPGHL